MSQEQRRLLAEMVMDPVYGPAKILGAAVSYVRMQGGPHCPRIADAADAAIVGEMQKIRAEQSSAAPLPTVSNTLASGDTVAGTVAKRQKRLNRKPADSLFGPTVGDCPRQK